MLARRLALALLRPYRYFAGLVALLVIVLIAIHLDIRQTLSSELDRLTATTNADLGNLRDAYSRSNYANWAGNWADIVERMHGAGVQRIYPQPVAVPLNRDLIYYRFDSPACRAFERSPQDALLVCSLYNPDSRRLHLVLAWHEPQWAVVREGDADPAKGDRISLNLPGVLEGELFVAPQVSYRHRALLDQCRIEWESPETSRKCDSMALAIYRVLPTGLLGAPLPRANGLAIRSEKCPADVAPPCVRAHITISARPPPSSAKVCLQVHDASERLTRSAVVARTCAESRAQPLPGRFLDSSRFPLGSSQLPCEDGVLCLCKKAKIAHDSCIGVADQPLSSASNEITATSLGVALRKVMRVSQSLTPIPPRAASAPFLGVQASEPIAFLVQRVDADDAIDAATPAPMRLILYLIALLAPIVVFGMAKFAVRDTARRERDATRRRLVEQELAHANASAKVALQAANTNLGVLGHEIMSPAQTLLNVLSEFQEQMSGRPWEPLVRESFLDMAEGCVRRMTRAAELVRTGLQMQRRHAELMAKQRPLDLGAFLSRRLELERLDQAMTYTFENVSGNAPVFADRGDLELVIGNVLSNARRFSATLPINVRLDGSPPFWVVSIRNEGPFIEAGQEERIFLPGVSLSPDPAADGLHGYGLFLARMAMSAMGGTISAENASTPATAGVTFKLAFPAAPRVGA